MAHRPRAFPRVAALRARRADERRHGAGCAGALVSSGARRLRQLGWCQGERQSGARVSPRGSASFFPGLFPDARARISQSTPPLVARASAPASSAHAPSWDRQTLRGRRCNRSEMNVRTRMLRLARMAQRVDTWWQRFRRPDLRDVVFDARTAMEYAVM